MNSWGPKAIARTGKQAAAGTLRLARRHRRTLLGHRSVVAALQLLRSRESASEDYLAAAAQMITLGHYRLAVAVLDRAEQQLGPSGSITRLRRTVPGYVGRIDRRRVRAAAAVLTGHPVRGVVNDPVLGGLSAGTVVIVRHTVPGHARSFIRKSTHRRHGREALLYRSGMVSVPERWWRAPRVLRVEEDETHWHLFLEDLRFGRRPRTVSDFVHAARGLGELGAEFRCLGPGPDWLTLCRTPSLHPYASGVRTCQPLLEPAVADRLEGTYRRLSQHQHELAKRFASLPTTLCHGDAHAGNTLLDPTEPGRIVLLDWAMVQRGPFGADLGRLLSVPYMSIRARPGPRHLRRGLPRNRRRAGSVP